ncbi:MAG: cytidine deaminase [Oscillospiraceae bacterium]|jgi:cytidine deaminase|nr:cytidine deaminase [Oscillospiraceae bacterium]
MGMTDRELLDRAIEAMERSYSPYSRFPVGAAIECDGGSVFTGCNIENASLGATVCAETAAVSCAVSAGHKKFTRIAIVSQGTEYCYPCGNCRQILNEFSPDIEVLCSRGDGRYVSYRLTSFLPMPFKNFD